MTNVRSELMPDHKIFELSDGRKFGAHKHSCLFCDHCSDIFWDYSNGIYAIRCAKNWDSANEEYLQIKLSFRGKCDFFREEKA